MTALLIATLLSADAIPPPPMVPAEPPAARQPLLQQPGAPRAVPLRPSPRAYTETPPEDGPRHLWQLSVAGGVVGVATWLGSILNFLGSIHCSNLFSNFGCNSGSGWGVLPFIGPYLALVGSGPSGPSGVSIALALSQTAALLMCIAGPFITIGDTRVTASPAGLSGTF
jgi:hypothetical protein